MRETIEAGRRQGRLLDFVKRHVGNSSLETCLGCGSCSNVCAVSGKAGMDPCMFMQMILAEQQEEALNASWLWYCSLCGSCSTVCPMSIDIPAVISLFRSLKAGEMLPVPLMKRLERWVSTGNTCSLLPGDYLDLVSIGQESLRKRTGSSDLKIPVDQKGAKVLLLLDPEVLRQRPSILADYALIFFMAGESWTISSLPLGTADLSLVTGEDEPGRVWLRKVCGLAGFLGTETVLIDDCHNRLSSFGVGGRLKKISHPFNVTTMPALVSRYIEMGKVEIKSPLAMTVTCQVPCSMSDGLGQLDLRTLCKAICEEVEDMAWPVINSACCGGSLLRAGLEGEMEGFYAAKSRELARMKSEAVVTFCATCFLQFLRLSKRGMASQNVLFFPEALSSCLS